MPSTGHNPTKKGDWLCNTGSDVRGEKCRCKVKQGPPKSVHKNYPEEKLIAMRLVGVYLDEDVPQGYYNLQKA